MPEARYCAHCGATGRGAFGSSPVPLLVVLALAVGICVIAIYDGANLPRSRTRLGAVCFGFRWESGIYATGLGATLTAAGAIWGLNALESST